MKECRIINPNNNIVWDSEIPHNGTDFKQGGGY